MGAEGSGPAKPKKIRVARPPGSRRLEESDEEHAAEVETAFHDLPKAEQRQALIAAGVGNALEWYDWTIYAFFAVYFAPQIFGGDPQAAAVWASIVFAIGFVARPAGGLILGWVADRKSRALAMFISIIVMCLGSLGIAFAPTAEMVGVWAGIWLLFIRVAQGAALGGELPAAVAYLVDFTKPGRRARFVASFSLTLVLGTLLGSTIGTVLLLFLSPEQMNDWGWRIPFFLGAVMAAFGFWLRTRAPHAPVAESDPKDRALWTLLTKYRPAIYRCLAVAAGDSLGFYAMATIFPEIAQSNGASSSDVFLTSMVGLVIMGFVVLGYARLADLYGLEKMLTIALISQAVVTLPVLLLLNGAFLNTLILQIIALVPIAMILGCDLLYVADQFPKKYRAMGMAISYTVTVSIFGGTASLVWDVMNGADVPWLFPLYVSVVSTVGAVFVFNHVRVKKARRTTADA
jgi:MHS family alpha-ketoglutarate permease-like MFS transporter